MQSNTLHIGQLSTSIYHRIRYIHDQIRKHVYFVLGCYKYLFRRRNVQYGMQYSTIHEHSRLRMRISQCIARMLTQIKQIYSVDWNKKNGRSSMAGNQDLTVETT